MDSYIDDKHWQTVFVQHVVSSYKHLCELRLLIRCRSLAFHHFFCGFLDRFEGCWDAGGTNPAISCRDFAILHRNVASMPLQCFLGDIWTEQRCIMFHHFRTAPGAFSSLDSKLPKTCTLSTCVTICSLGSTLRELRKRCHSWICEGSEWRRPGESRSVAPRTLLSAQGSEPRHSPPFLMLPWPAGLVQKARLCLSKHNFGTMHGFSCWNDPAARFHVYNSNKQTRLKAKCYTF